MLRATVLLENLKNNISFAHHGISQRNQLPILLNFLLETKGGNLYVSATDLEIGIKAEIPARVEGEGATTVSAKTFLDLITNINTEKIELLEKEGKLELLGNKTRTRFPTNKAEDFPQLYESKGQKQAEFKKNEFDENISRVVFAAAQDLGRPALSGVLVKKEASGKLSMVATDGYRLSLKQEAVLGNTKEGRSSFLIPARIIKELLLVKNDSEKLELFSSDLSNQVVFEIGGVIVVGRLIEAEYPDYQKIIPDDYGTQAFFDKSEAQNAVRTCSVFAREAANIVKMNIGKNKIVFSASASSAGENEVEIDAKTTGEENEIAFNARYLLEFFSNIDEDEIIFEMTGPLSPGVFKLEKDKNYLHLIMPIRVQG